jgi:small subunit ribosomal protein S6
LGNYAIVSVPLGRKDSRYKDCEEANISLWRLYMKKYELMTIAKGKLGEESARSLSNSVKDLILANSGKVLNSNFWGKRKFAYEIKGQTEGWYDVIEFDGEESNVSKLKQKLNIIDDLVRYLIILADETADGGKDGKKSK